MAYSKRYIITGGPGSGKSTLLDELKKRTFCCYDEVSRMVIREQQSLNTDKLPWVNLAAFADICYQRMSDLLGNTTETTCFFDRGIPDIIAYLRRAKLDVPPQYLQSERLYNKTAFILPPWRDIFVNDNERPDTFEQSEEIYKYLKLTYKELGFTLIELPKISVEKRADYVINYIDSQIRCCF